MLTNKLCISYGQKPLKMIKELLEHLDLARQIPRGARIGLKPNLVVAKPAADGATTAPELVEGIIQYLQDHGQRNLVIAEGSWIGDSTKRAFKVCGYTELGLKYGVPLVDLQKDGYHTRRVEDLDLKICDEMSRIDYLINLPVLKGHCQTKITCALKNLKGCIPDQEKRRFHTLGLHRPIAYLNKALTSHLVIVDGLIGDLDFEEGGNPVQMDRIIVGTDPVLVDSYVATLLGYDPSEIPYISISENLGVGQTYRPSTEIEVLNSDQTVTRIKASRGVEALSRFVLEDEACSACYGSLIHALARLNEQGLLKRISRPISIGQGFKSQKSKGLGIGSCTSGFSQNVAGCPPTAKAILDFIYEDID